MSPAWGADRGLSNYFAPGKEALLPPSTPLTLNAPVCLNYGEVQLLCPDLANNSENNYCQRPRGLKTGSFGVEGESPCPVSMKFIGHGAKRASGFSRIPVYSFDLTANSQSPLPTRKISHRDGGPEWLTTLDHVHA